MLLCWLLWCGMRCWVHGEEPQTWCHGHVGGIGRLLGVALHGVLWLCQSELGDLWCEPCGALFLFCGELFPWAFLLVWGGGVFFCFDVSSFAFVFEGFSFFSPLCL